MEPSNSSKSKVLVTIIHQGWIRPEMLTVVSLLSRDSRVEVSIVPIQMRPYENALNTALKIAHDYDFLLTLDHDNVPKNNPIDLVFMDKDIIGMPYLGYQKNEAGQLEVAFLAMDKQENGEYLDHRNMEGLQEVDAVASGAMLISKKVIESGAYFARKWDEKGFAVTGIDFHFCEKVKEAGFKVFAHYDYLASHFKEIDLLDVLAFKAK